MNLSDWKKRGGFALSLIGVLSLWSARTEADEPIAIEPPAADREIDFSADVLPVLQRNCLACHSASVAEGDVVLEKPEVLRAEREGAVLVVSGDPAASRLLSVAAHRAEPFMPPADNAVGAVALTPAELGLLERWIQQGAKDSRAAVDSPINWQPVPDGHRPILATAVAAAGDVAVCARGSELFVYGLQQGVQHGQELARLVDPALDAAQVGPDGAAHLDMIRAVAIRPDADLIASAGFRSVKLWQRYQPSSEIGPVIARAVLSTATQDGTQLAVASEDGSIQRIVASGDKPAVTWKAHDQPIIGLVFARNGQVLMSAAQDGVVRAWQSETGAALGGWQLSVPPKQIVMPADDLLVTASGDLALRVWALAIPSEPPKEGVPAELPKVEPARALAGHGRQIAALAAVSGAPRQFLSGSVDGSVRRWNADDGSQLNQWIHGDAVSSIAVSGDGSRFVSIGADRAAKVWNTSAPEPVVTLTGDYRQARQVERLGRLVEVAGANSKEAQDDLQNVEKQLATEVEAKTKSVAARDEAQKVLAEKTSALADVTTKHEAAAKTLADSVLKRSEAEQSLAAAATRTADSEKELVLLDAAVKRIEVPEELAAATAALEKVRQDRQAYLQTLARDAQAALDATTKQRDEAQAAHDALAKQVEEAKTASTAATAAVTDAEAILARTEEAILTSTKTVETAKQAAEQVSAKAAAAEKLRNDTSQQAQETRPAFATAVFPPDGKRLLLADDRGRMFTYDSISFAPLGAWEGEAATPVGGVFVGDQSLVQLTRSADGEGKLTRWAVTPAWKLAVTIGSPSDAETLVDRVLSVDFAPDGTLLATGGGEPSRSGQIAIWNVSDGSLVRRLEQPHSDTVFGLAFSPDGEYLASAAADRTMKVFRTATGELVRTFEGHTDHVLGVSWRANGKQLATCSADNKVKIWDFTLGEQRRTIDAGGKEVTAVTFVGTGSKLVSSSGDRNVRMHNADDGAVIRTYSGATDYLFSCAANGPGSLIVAGGADRVLRVWNGEDGTEVLKIEAKD